MNFNKGPGDKFDLISEQRTGACKYSTFLSLISVPKTAHPAGAFPRISAAPHTTAEALRVISYTARDVRDLQHEFSKSQTHSNGF